MAGRTYRKFSKKRLSRKNKLYKKNKLSKKNKLRKGKRKSLRSKRKNIKYGGEFFFGLDPGYYTFIVNKEDAELLIKGNGNPEYSLGDMKGRLSIYAYFINFSTQYKKRKGEARRKASEYRFTQQMKQEKKEQMIMEKKQEYINNNMDPSGAERKAKEELEKVNPEISKNEVEEKYGDKLNADANNNVLSSNKYSWFDTYDVELDKNYKDEKEFIKDKFHIYKQIQDQWGYERRRNARGEYFETDVHKNIQKIWMNGRQWIEDIYRHSYMLIISQEQKMGSKYYDIKNLEEINTAINAENQDPEGVATNRIIKIDEDRAAVIAEKQAKKAQSATSTQLPATPNPVQAPKTQLTETEIKINAR